MGFRLGIGNIDIRNVRPFDWAAYWASQPEVLFFGLYSDISGGQMPNRVPGATDYLTVAGAVGSETYQCPNTAPYIAADTDYIWFQTDTTQRTTTTAELIGYDFTRTIIKYDNTTPYALRWIMILSEDYDTPSMRNSFDLSIWWSNVLSSYGSVKGNRASEQSIWRSPSELVLTVISGGVQIDWEDTSLGVAETEIWGQSDGGAYALIDTVVAGIITYDDTTAPVDMRYYKLRFKYGSTYGKYSDVISITMLSAEMINQATWAAVGLAYWDTKTGAVGDGTKITFDGGTANVKKNAFWILGRTYRIRTSWVVTSGNINDFYSYALPHVRSASGDYDYIYDDQLDTQVECYCSVGQDFIGELTAVSIKEVLVP